MCYMRSFGVATPQRSATKNVRHMLIVLSLQAIIAVLKYTIFNIKSSLVNLFVHEGQKDPG